METFYLRNYLARGSGGYANGRGLPFYFLCPFFLRYRGATIAFSLSMPNNASH